MLHLSLTVVDTTDGDGVLVTVRRSNVRFVKDGVARALTGCLREGAKSYAKVEHVLRWRRGCFTPVQVARTFSPFLPGATGVRDAGATGGGM